MTKSPTTKTLHAAGGHKVTVTGPAKKTAAKKPGRKPVDPVQREIKALGSDRMTQYEPYFVAEDGLTVFKKPTGITFGGELSWSTGFVVCTATSTVNAHAVCSALNVCAYPNAPAGAEVPPGDRPT